MSAEESIYSISLMAGQCLCHGEILSMLPRIALEVQSIQSDQPDIIRTDYPYVVLLSQSCDLVQDYSAPPDKKTLPNLLFCHAPTAEELRATCGGSDIWKRIKQNKDERYHFLEQVPSTVDLENSGIPELTIDFKRYFTIPTEEAYARIQLGTTKRRCFLKTPYIEHLSSRFGYFLSRVALPRDHVSV